MIAPAMPIVEKTKRVKEEIKRRALKIKARTDLTAFSCYTDPAVAADYRARHQIILDKALMRVELGETKRLMVFMPPRHWKTSKVSQKFAQWFIGKRYSENRPYSVMLGSYGATLSEEISRTSRDVVRDNPLFGDVFPQCRIARNLQRPDSWGLRRKDDLGDEAYPAMTAVGVGGGALGKGADLLLIDDPVKGMADAMSPAVQKSQWDWYVGTARKRLNPGGAIVMVMQRWSQMDLAGQILAKAEAELGEEWEVLVLPALAYTEAERVNARRQGVPVPDEDPLGREPGEALWPEKYDAAYHAHSKALDPDTFSAVDQQVPQKAGGYLIGRDDFKILEERPDPKDVVWVGCVDVALTEKEVANKHRTEPDYTVTGELGLWTPEGDQLNARLVLDKVRYKQTKDPDLFVKESILASDPSVSWYFAQDNVDKMVENVLQRDARLINRSLIRLPHVKGDKVVRSLAWRNRVKNGRFYLVRGDWNNFFFECCEGFPRTWPDDPIDMVSVGAHAHGVSAGDGVEYVPNIWDN